MFALSGFIHRYSAKTLIVFFACCLLSACNIGKPSVPNSATHSKPLPTQPKRVKTLCAGVPVVGVHEHCGRFYPDPTRPEIYIAYAVLTPEKIRTFNTSDFQNRTPVVYLSGGPGEGGNTLSSKLNLWRYRMLDWPIQRPLILWDSRGNRGAWGYFHCEPFRQLQLSQLNSPELIKSPERVNSPESPEKIKNAEHSQKAQTSNQSLPQLNTTTQKCLARWQQQLQGTGFQQFTAKQNAEDVGRLLLHLGYAQWHLMAVSYGSRVAEWLLARYPKQVTSAIFDSPYSWHMTQRQLKIQRWGRVIAEQKNAMPALNHAINALAAEPLKISFELDGLRHRAWIDDIQLLHLLFASLYAPNAQIIWQQALNDFSDGDSQPLSDILAPLLAASLHQHVSPWLYWVAECMDNGVESTADYLDGFKAGVSKTDSPKTVSPIGQGKAFSDAGLARYWQPDTGLLLCNKINNNAKPASPYTLNENVTDSAAQYERKQYPPVLLLMGGQDPVVKPEDTKAFNYLAPQVIWAKAGSHGLLANDSCGDQWQEAFWRSVEMSVATGTATPNNSSFDGLARKKWLNEQALNFGSCHFSPSVNTFNRMMHL